MFRAIKLKGCMGEDITVEFLANAATPRRYKQIFREDLLQKFMDARKEKDGKEVYNIDFLSELSYIMAMQAAAKRDSGIKLDMLNENAFINWLEQFESMALETAANEITDVYLGNVHTDSESKKNTSEQSGS